MEERRRYLALYHRSGLKRPDFCRRYKIAYTTLCGWERRLGKTKTRVSFQRVKMSPLTFGVEPVIAELVLEGGIRVRVMRDCSAAQLAGIVEAVGRCGR